jgi:ElaB/YqjD/DUF883 family membrane-anchored ribosome-binding protein
MRLYDEFDQDVAGAAEDAANAGLPAGRRARNRVRAAADAVQQAATTAGETAASHVRTVEREAVVWAEEARQRGAAAAQSLGQAAEDIGSSLNQGEIHRKMHDASRAIGRTVGRIRNVRGQQVAGTVKEYVREHPSSLFGAAALGFVLGRLMRRS